MDEWVGKQAEQRDLRIHEEFTRTDVQPLGKREPALQPCPGGGRTPLKLIDLPMNGARGRQKQQVVGGRSERFRPIGDRERFRVFRAQAKHPPESVQQAPQHRMLRSFAEQRVGTLERALGFVAGAEHSGSGKTVKRLDGDFQRVAFGSVRRLPEQGVVGSAAGDELEHPPPHLSAYGLTVEPGTPLAADPARHPDDDIEARRYERAEAVLTGAGYTWEEISNWARPGHECRHNHLYWEQGDYVGIGAAAHLINFKGTDTVAGIRVLQQYYQTNEMEGFSVPAAEHSTITAWGRDNEVLAYSNMLTQFPTGIVAVVSDSYNVYDACEKLWGDVLHDKVLAREGTLTTAAKALRVLINEGLAEVSPGMGTYVKRG